MYEHEPYEESVMGQYGTAKSKIIIKSPGWSGDIIRTNARSDSDRKFQFDITGSMNNWNGSVHYEVEGHGGYVNYRNEDIIIGISLEHMGALEPSADYIINQLRGYVLNGNIPQIVPAFGGVVGAESLSVDDGYLFVEEYTVTTPSQETTQTNVGYRHCNFPAYETSPFYTELNPNWSPNRTNNSEGTLETDLPIFETDADLLAWINDPENPETIAKMLNPPGDAEAEAEKEYEAAQRYYYLRNKFRAISNGSEYNVTINNFNIKPYGKGRICLYKTKHESLGGGKWYSYYLKGADSYDYEFKSAPWNSFRWSDDDQDVTESYITHRVNSIGYVKKSATYSKADVEFIVEYADTNIPIFGSEDLADQFIDEEIDIDQAENYDEILQEEQKHILPPWGEEDTDADNGTNIQDYSIGARMFWLNGQELEGFFAAVYDPANLNDILDNNGLFGQNQINCIQSIMSLPVPPTNFATSGGHENIKLGGWDSDVGGFVIKRNNKLWDVGSTYITPVFNDFRDMEPYQQLFISLPFCGLHALSLSKYLGHTLSVKYACDLTSGSCTAHIYSDGVEYDAFDGNMASFRPITALDQQSQISAMLQSVTKLIEPTIDLVAGGGDVVGGALSGNVGTAISGGLQGAVALPKMAFSAVEAKNAFTQKPTTFKGGFLGALGLFGNRRCHLIVAQRNTVRATNELETIGYPSGYGGFVASFSGYLQCSSFKMAEGFTGTAEEAAEIIAMMAEGVYL